MAKVVANEMKRNDMTENDMTTMTLDRAYDRRTVWLHWLVALLVIGLWIAGQCINFMPRGTPKIMFRSAHIAVGVLLALFWMYRIYWRAFRGVKLPSVNTGWIGRLSHGYHHGLYALIGLLVLSGLAAVWIRGDNLFELFIVPAFDPGNKELRRNAVQLHEWLANGLLAAAGLHMLAACWHHWKLKDGLMSRMWPHRPSF